MATTGNGGTISFATSGFGAAYQSIGAMNQTIQALNDSSLGNTTHETYTPGDLIETDEISLELFWDPEVALPTLGTEETVTFTFPKKDSSNSTASKIVGDAILLGRTYPTQANNELMMATVTLKFNGANGPTVSLETL